MAGKGGYQRPENPAPVSGPGAHSQRTDGGPGTTATQAARYISGGAYGEGQEINGLARSAPLAAAPTYLDSPLVAFHEPTQRPDEPVTSGASFGAGPGPEVLPPVPQDDTTDYVSAAIRAAYAQFPSPYLRRTLDRLEAEGR